MPKSISYYSTNRRVRLHSFEDALLAGLAPDRGLFMPERIPRLNEDAWKRLHRQSYPDIAFAILSQFLQEDLIASDLLKKMVYTVYDFVVPLEHIEDRNYIMRLDCGASASFKDFAAGIMAQLMQYVLRKKSEKIFILTATSGDTGSAVANAFYDLDNIEVVILYPEGQISEFQRKQMSTLQKNVHLFAVKGSFDDCQDMVKRSFLDETLIDFHLTSANSISIGRLLPQIIYYCYAYLNLVDQVGKEIVFAVPSGNFGSVMGCLLAKNMGLPVKKIIIATNANDAVPRYLETKDYKPCSPTHYCLSSAMNIGNPSNIARIIALYGGRMDERSCILEEPDFERMQEDFFAVSISDQETRETMRSFYNKYKILLEPHGAVAWQGLLRYREHISNTNNIKKELCVCLETAHPAKFSKEMEEILEIAPSLPAQFNKIMGREESIIKIENNYEEFKAQLRSI